MAHKGDSIHQHANISKESELQKTIADEKLRAEQHKLNYQTLKHDYVRLQEEHMLLQSEMERTFEEMKLVREKDKQLLEQARQEIIKKVKEIEMLKFNVVDSEKAKLLEMRLKNEIESTVKDKLKQIELECDELRGEYNKLKVENTFLKSEYDNDRLQHSNLLENLKLKHETELSGMRKEKEKRLSEHQLTSLQDFQQMKQLQRENSQLSTKIKFLTSELEELKARKDVSANQIDSINRINSKVAFDYQSTIKAYEVEKQTFKAQIESIQKELKLALESKNDISNAKLDVERQNSLFKNSIDELEHRLKKDTAQIKIDMLKERATIEEEKSKYYGLYHDACTELEACKISLSSMEEMLRERDKDVIRRVQLLKEEHWKDLTSSENERMQIEMELKRLQQEMMNESDEKSKLAQRMEMRTNELEDSNDCLRKEITALKNKITNQQSLLNQLEELTVENSNLKSKLNRLELDYHSLLDAHNEAVNKSDRLEKHTQNLEKQLQSTRLESTRVRNEVEREISERVNMYVDDKCRMQAKLDELDALYNLAQRKLSNNLKSYKQKKAQLKRLLIRHKEKINSLNNKLHQQQLQQQRHHHHYNNSDHVISANDDVILSLKHKLKDILQRNDEFRKLLMTTKLNNECIGGLPFASIDNNDYLPYSNGKMDWSSLKRRLHNIGQQQEYQLVKLKVGQSTTSLPGEVKSVNDNYNNNDTINNNNNNNNDRDKNANKDRKMRDIGVKIACDSKNDDRIVDDDDKDKKVLVEDDDVGDDDYSEDNFSKESSKEEEEDNDDDDGDDSRNKKNNFTIVQFGHPTRICQ